MEYTSIKYIPTGNIFKMPTEDVKEILKTDRGNFEIVGGENIPEEKQEIDETTTYEMVVDDADEAFKKNLKKMTVPELIEFCNEHNIVFDKNDKKADLIQKIIDETNKE